MYEFKERLNIQSDVFSDFRSQFDVLLSALLQEANTTGKEGELTVKLRVDTTTARNFAKGDTVKEWTEPRLSWTLSRKVKESKFDVKSAAGEGYALTFDEDGHPIVKDAPNKQLSLFDMDHQRKEAANAINEICENIEDAASFGLEVPDPILDFTDESED